MTIRDRDFKALTVDHFKGLLTTIAANSCPPDYSPICDNAQFTNQNLSSRPGTTTFLNLGGGTDIYHSEFVLFNDTRFYLFLMNDHKLYYCTDVAPTRVLLLTPSASPTNFKVAVYGNFVYIFLSGGNGTFGTSGPYVWDPTKLPTIQVDLATIRPEQNITTNATGTLTSTGTNVADGDTVTVTNPSFGLFGPYAWVYTFKTALTGSQGLPGEVKIGSNAAGSLVNLKAAMNRDPGTEGVSYGLGTVPGFVTFQATTITATTLVIQATASGASQNAITTTETSTQLSWGSGTLTGGGKLDAGDGLAGNCNGGYHAIRVLFRTRTGYISSPSDARVCLIRQDQSTLPLTNIPLYTGATGHIAAECTGRVIIMTPGSGDITDEEDLLDPETWKIALNNTYYWALEINDNTTTTGTVNISDAQLIEETNATDNFQFTSPLPFFSIGKVYKNRMVCAGDVSNPTLAYISELPDAGGAQAFRGDVGFLDINHDDGVALVNLFVLRDFIYFVKGIGLYGTSDNGDDPFKWPLVEMSAEVGTATLSGVSENSDEEFVVILDFKGMYLFTGSSPEKMSKNIQPDWDAISEAAMATAEIHIDTVKRRVHCLVATGVNTRPNRDIVCDYWDGWPKVRWSTWYPQTRSWRSMMVDTGGFRMLVCLDSQNVQKFDDAAITDNNIAIAYHVRLGIMAPGKFGMALFSGFDMLLNGADSMTIKAYDENATLLQTFNAVAMSPAAAPDSFVRANLRIERIFIDFSHNSTAAYSSLGSFSLFTKESGVRAY